MNRYLYFLVLAFTISILAAGCKDKEEKVQAPPPPPPVVMDTTPVVAEDTMPAIQTLPGMPAAPSGDGYAVQVAACTDEAYARYQVELWTKRGYEPFVSNFSHGGETHYRVRLGLFATLGEAKQKAGELADKYSLKTWIDPVSN